MEKAIAFRIRLSKFSVLINLDLMNRNFDNLKNNSKRLR